MTEELEKVDKNNDKEYVLKKKRAKAGDAIWLRVWYLRKCLLPRVLNKECNLRENNFKNFAKIKNTNNLREDIFETLQKYK